MVTVTETQFYTHIARLFPNTPIATSSGSTSTVIWMPQKTPDGERLMAYLFSSAGTGTPIAGYRRVDLGATTLEITWSSRIRRFGITDTKTHPKTFTTGSTSLADFGGYTSRFWYIPADYLSDTQWVNFITAVAANPANPSVRPSPYAGKKPPLWLSHFNDFSESKWQFGSRPQGSRA